MPNHFAPLRAACFDVLCHPGRYNWTAQGLGMLRCHPFTGNDFRLNIWHSRLLIAKVSELHDHPWDLTSWIIEGKLGNNRCIETPDRQGAPYLTRTINCGEDFGDGKKSLVYLRAGDWENYGPGDVYQQLANEIHRTRFEDFTVTLNHRVRTKGQAARIFWPVEDEWIDAGPREATPEEIRELTSETARRMIGI